MLPALLLGLTAGFAPIDVSLDDLKQFTITDPDLRDRIQLVFQFRDFLHDRKLSTDNENFAHTSKISSVFLDLKCSRDTMDCLQSRLAALRALRKDLGKEDYYAGKLPQVCPPRHQRAFEQWLKDFDVSLQDLPRFGVTAAEVRDRYTVVRQFLEFMASGRTDPKTIMEDLKSRNVYDYLGGALDTSESPKSRRMSLISLQRELGKKDYAAGKLPPACPAKYKDIFERWLNDPKAKRKAGGVRKEAT